jgi:hypothetical protein
MRLDELKWYSRNPYWHEARIVPGWTIQNPSVDNDQYSVDCYWIFPCTPDGRYDGRIAGYEPTWDGVDALTAQCVIHQLLNPEGNNNEETDADRLEPGSYDDDDWSGAGAQECWA